MFIVKKIVEELNRSLHFDKEMFLNGQTPASFIVYFWSLQTNIITIFVHSVYGAGILTHDLHNMSLLA